MSSTRVWGGVRRLAVPFVTTVLGFARVSAHDVESLPPNPAIVALADAVSADSLRASVETLIAFGTRHANSDTSSQTTGIGAARRWVLERLKGASGGALRTEYVSFDTTACGLRNVHRNVLATLAGSGSVDRSFLVSAHLDSRTEDVCDRFASAPGANDDASGVALVLEMARLLASTTTDANLIFVAVAAEELGLLGSRALATTFVGRNARIDGMITNDIVGNVTGCADPACPPGEPVIVDSMSVRHFSRGPSTSIHRQLTRAMALVAMRYVPELSVTLVPAEDRPMRAGDHVPFADAGYAAARFTEANEDGDGTGANGHQHNGNDLTKVVDMPYLARITRLNVAGFANLAMAPESPSAPSVLPMGGGQLSVSWPSVDTTLDLAGYRVALRDAFSDSLFYFRVADAGLDPGPTQTYVLDGIDETQAVHVSVSAYDGDWNESIFSAETFLGPLVSAPEVSSPVVPALRVLSAPDAAAARVRVSIPRSMRVSVDVVDATGRRVARLVDEHRTAGMHDVVWDTRNESTRVPAPSGIYFLRLRLGTHVAATEKLTIVR